MIQKSLNIRSRILLLVTISLFILISCENENKTPEPIINSVSHGTSEYIIDSQRALMEIHLAYQDPNIRLLVVNGVLFEEGESNMILETYLEDLPELADEEFINTKEYNVTGILPNDLDFYTYSGSLTTPACSKIIT